LRDTASDFGSATGVTIVGLTRGLASAGPDELPIGADSEFGCEAGVTTAEGKLLPAPGLPGSESGGLVPPLDWDKPGTVATVDAVEVVAFTDGTFPAPGDPRPGNTVPSCRLPRSGCAASGREGVLALVELAAVRPGSSGKVMGAPGGGGVGKPVADSFPVLIAGGAGRRRKIPTIPADTPAACAPCPAPAIALDGVLTISMTRLPSERRT